MWSCPTCERQFKRISQQHSCARKPINDHFVNKYETYKLYQTLLHTIGSKVGNFKVLSIPCCIHLVGGYDFIAILPKRRGVLELRFALNRALKNKRIFASVSLSSKSYKNCLLIKFSDDINSELITWLKESYELK